MMSLGLIYLCNKVEFQEGVIVSIDYFNYKDLVKDTNIPEMCVISS